MRQAMINFKQVTGKLTGASLVLILGFAFIGNSAMGQCDVDQFVDDCAGTLGEDYSYLRMFDAEEIEGATNYPYTGAFLFRKGINYVFTSCAVSDSNAPVVVNLYNRTRKLVASTYNEETDKHYEKMIFKCNATGIFFVQTLTTVNESSCGITMLGFSVGY